VILPEIIPAKRWQNLLHNQRALIIQAALLFKPKRDRHGCAVSPGAIRGLTRWFTCS